MENKTEITIPFDGFYNSISERRVDERLFDEWCSETNNLDYIDTSELQGDDSDAFYDWCDDRWEDARLEYVEDYVDNFFAIIKGVTGVDLDYTDLVIDSPREYNFATDRIFIKVDGDKLKKLFKLTDRKLLAEQIKADFTSYDGFSSSYSNDINHADWKLTNFDHNSWLTVFKVLLKQFDVQLCELYEI